MRSRFVLPKSESEMYGPRIQELDVCNGADGGLTEPVIALRSTSLSIRNNWHLLLQV